jgi:hypothetical protein
VSRVLCAVAESDRSAGAQVGGDRVIDTVAEGNCITAEDFDSPTRTNHRRTAGGHRVTGAVAERDRTGGGEFEDVVARNLPVGAGDH